MLRQAPVRRRATLAALLSGVMSLPLLAAVPASAGTPAEASALARKADDRVLARFADQDRTTFWVRLDSTADLAAAAHEKAKARKGRAVLAAETAHAARAQAGLKALLKKEGAAYRGFWIDNSLRVTGDKALAEKLAARPEVAAVEADDPVELPAPLPGTDEPAVDAVEWNISRIGADKVWKELGDRGEGIVVANIDSGVQYNHPALVRNYRGTRADGTFDHAYNWFDPTGVCSAGQGPCDNHGHGTHTMGTMAGDDGLGNQVGVAPGATWIAAKGCADSSCDRAHLLAAAEWMIAPTDADGANPRPDLAPDVINNSWGANVLDTWLQQTVRSWRAAGIFPAFSNGNAGPECNTAGSPGAYPESYASGAYDSSGAIAGFSSRGTGVDGAIKPDIAAPGVNIRSSWTGGSYSAISGTSMASPHTAATVALMWSAAPALRGDVAETVQLLDTTAVDVDATGCGGTAADNNTFGEGKLDAYAAVLRSPRGPVGALTGTVTGSDGKPLAGATVALHGPLDASFTTGADGSFSSAKLSAGDYTATVSKFGYLTAASTLTVTEGQTTSFSAVLDSAPTATLTGSVRSSAGAEAGARLAVQGTPVTATAGADGRYTLTLPLGAYVIAVTPGTHCAATASFPVDLRADGTHDVDLADLVDDFGTDCREGTDTAFPTGTTRLALNGTAGSAQFDSPFQLPLYGETYSRVTVSVEGMAGFQAANATVSANTSLPTGSNPNTMFYPFWDDLTVPSGGGVYWSARGTAPHRELVVEWRNVAVAAAPAERLSFALVVGEDGTYSYHYKDVGTGANERGTGATVGVEAAGGDDALLYSYNQPVLADGRTIAFRPTRSAVVSGTVTDANDGKPVPYALISVYRGIPGNGGGVAAADGTFLVQVANVSPANDWKLYTSATDYVTELRTIALAPGAAYRTDTVLQTGRVTAAPGGFTVVVPKGETRTRTLTLANDGYQSGYSVKEKSGAAWVKADPASGTLDKGAGQDVRLTFDPGTAAPGSVLRGTVVVTSRSGRDPTVEVPVTVVVPAYATGIDAGADTSATDALGDAWVPDREYTEGSYGYLGRSGVLRTNKTVAGTDEQTLYRTATQGAYEYRFDGLPDGTYQVELGLAEISGTKPDQRVFDVLAEGAEKLRHVDIALEAGGTYRALTKTFTVRVTDGQLNVRLVSTDGKSLVNTLRVTHRPDLAG
ncbi:S8 family serine peptidase [Streptomyces sp. NPDC051940]|uniref:S8 family serine peptidase n=1 Tax=Streptomyces sp. NPDC051940 TaxID=3155675 RepID=UPI00341E0D17